MKEKRKEKPSQKPYVMTEEDYVMEQWKPIVVQKNGNLYNYTGKYEVSDYGRVRSLNYKRQGYPHILKPASNTSGYPFVVFTVDGKRENFTVHRLVGCTFIPNFNPNEYYEVNHLNENKWDNRLENLMWTDRYGNVVYGTRTERQSDTMRKPVICLETMRIYESQLEAGEVMGFDEETNLQSQISRSCMDKTHKTTCKGYHFMFLEDFQRKHNLSTLNIGRLHIHDYADKYICWENPYNFDEE